MAADVVTVAQLEAWVRRFADLIAENAPPNRARLAIVPPTTLNMDEACKQYSFFFFNTRRHAIRRGVPSCSSWSALRG